MNQKPIEPLKPMTVEEINALTDRARALPPSGDQAHVLIDDGEDPWVISHEGLFYYCTVDRSKKKILIAKFDSLEQMRAAPLIEVWPARSADPPAYLEIWSPELQFLHGRWYIYFTLYDGELGRERMYVIESVSDDAPGDYVFKAKLNIETDRWAIDGSVLVMSDGQEYFIWSGWDGEANDSQNIYIARMSDPWTIVSDRVCISRPEHDWERRGYSDK